MSKELTFEEGDDTQCAEIGITDDDKLELEEDILVSISRDSQSIDLSPENATITIVDTSSKGHVHLCYSRCVVVLINAPMHVHAQTVVDTWRNQQ